MATIPGWEPDKPAIAGWEPDEPVLNTMSSHSRGKRVLPPKGVMQRVKEALPSRKTVARYARPILEGAGMVAGGIIGAAGGSAVPVLGTAAGTVAGSALGYGMGSQATDIIEGPSATQVRQPFIPGELSNPKYRPRTAGEEVGNVVNKLKTGAEIEMGGQIAGKVAGRVVNGLVDASRKGMPLRAKRTRLRAAEEYDQVYTPSAKSAEKNKLRQAETEAVMNRIGTKAQPTPGQTTDNFNARKFEQARASKDVSVGNEPSFGELLIDNDAVIRKDATSNLKNKLGPGAPLPSVQSRDITGSNIVKAISDQKTAAKAAQKAVWAKVPDYPIPAENLSRVGREVRGKAMPADSRKVVDSMQDYINEELSKNNNTQGLQSVERSLGKAIKKAHGANDAETAGHLETLRKAVRDDFNAIGEAADRGDIMVSGGKVIIPSRLKADIAMIDEQIAAQQASGGTPDKMALMKAVQAKQGSFMPSTGMTDKAHLEKLTTEFKKFYPDEPVPMVGGGVADPKLEGLTTRHTALQQQLDAAEPADDVAKAYSAAKKYSHEEVFKKYYRGAVQDVLAQGNQASGRRVINESVAPRFLTTRTGAKDLYRSLIPPKGTLDPVTGDVMNLPERMLVGRQKAARQAMPAVIEKMISSPGIVDTNTGIMNIPGARAFLRQNPDVLHELGLTSSVKQVIKDQIPRSIENALEATGKFDALGTPEMTAIQAYKLMRKMAPAMRETYGLNSEAMQGLKDYAEALRIIGRNKNVSAVGGSTTMEKATGDTAVGVGKKLVQLLSVMSGHGWTYSATEGLIGSLFKGRLAVQRAQIDALLREAVFNKDAREALMKVAKAKPANVGAAAQKYLTPFIRQLAVTATQPPQEQSDASSTP